MKIKKKHLIIFVIISMIFYSWVFFTPEERRVETKTYNEFLTLTETNKVRTVDITSGSGSFVFTTTDDMTFKTSHPKSEDFKERLLLKGIEVIESEPETGIADYIGTFTSLLLIGILLFAVKSMNRGSKNKEISEDNGNIPPVTFDNVIANEDMLNEVRQYVDFLKNPKKYHDMGAKMPRGLIFYGPPGTGKTLTAKAIAGEAGVPFYSVSGSDFVEVYVGVGALRVRGLFKQARKKKNCIIFIDELDAIGGKRGRDSNSEARQTINALLAEMDGFDSSDGILVIGATNRFEELDSALIRAGRFDRHIAVPLPETSRERERLFQLYTKPLKLSDNVDLKSLSKETLGFSPATISSLTNDAALIAVMDNKTAIEKDHFEKAIFRRLTHGHEKTNSDHDDQTIIAYHEAGHALITKLVTKLSVPKITIMGSTSGVGGATFILPEKLGLHTEEELIHQIMINYGGRAAEHILQKDLSKVTSGAQSDLKTISSTLKQMYMEYGMMGSYINRDILPSNSEKNIETIENYAKNLYEETYELLSKHLDKLDALATLLIEKETVYEEELDRIVKGEKS